jgi:cysteine desulfurase / selenocysteine lyase
VQALPLAGATHAGALVLRTNSAIGHCDTQRVGTNSNVISSGTAIADLRAHEFAWPDNRIYLNAASFGPLPDRARRAIEQFHTQRWQATLTDPDLVAPLNATRNSAAQLIGASPDEIALSPNTNFGINIAAAAVSQLASDRRVILIHDREFPANVYPWLFLERQGFVIEVIPCDERGWPREAAMLERLEVGDVAAISVSFVQFASGFRADLESLGAACRRHETLFIVDAIQGLGALPLDVPTSQIDILACGAQKWLCAPWGSGFTFVRRDLIKRFEPMQPGWLAFEASQDFTHLLDYRCELLDDARRFEVGSIGFQDYVGLNESLQVLLELGIDVIWQHIREIQAPIIEWAQQHDVAVLSDLSDARRSGVLVIQPPGTREVFQQLVEAGVRAALREDAIRISPHWYNTLHEIERVVSVLSRTL